MARNREKIRRNGLHKIGSYNELRMIRREIDMELWYIENKLADDVAEAFSFNNLVSLVAPRGSVVDRMASGVSSGLAVVRGFFKGLKAIRGHGGGCGCGC